MPMTYFTVAHGCMLAAIVLPWVCAGIGKWGTLGKSPEQGGYDNGDPRRWWANQTDWRARANAAQANSFEVLPFFIAAVLLAHMLQAPQTLLDVLAFLFVVLRILYIMMYVAGFATVRSLLWASCFVINLVIFFLGYR